MNVDAILLSEYIDKIIDAGYAPFLSLWLKLYSFGNYLI